MLDNSDNISVNMGSESTESSNVTCEFDVDGDCMSYEEYEEFLFDWIKPSEGEIFIIILSVLVFFVGLIGNFLVCLAVRRNHHMRTVTNIFIVNLAVADFMVILICLPSTLLVDITETWFLGRVMCKLVQILQIVSVSVSVLTLSAISLERWYAICYPLKFKSTISRARIIIILIWIISIITAIPDVIVLDVSSFFEQERFAMLFTSCSPTWSPMNQLLYQMFQTIVLFFLPVGLMGFTYIHISIVLWKNSIPGVTETTSKPMLDGRSSTAESQLQSRRKAAVMLITVVIVFLVCYLPVHLLHILRFVGALHNKDTTLIVTFAQIAHWLCYFNSSVNPVIYNFMSAKFRKEFKATFSCCRRRIHGPNRQRTRGDSYAMTSVHTTCETEQFTMTTVK